MTEVTVTNLFKFVAVRPAQIPDEDTSHWSAIHDARKVHSRGSKQITPTGLNLSAIARR